MFGFLTTSSGLNITGFQNEHVYIISTRTLNGSHWCLRNWEPPPSSSSSASSSSIIFCAKELRYGHYTVVAVRLFVFSSGVIRAYQACWCICNHNVITLWIGACSESEWKLSILFIPFFFVFASSVCHLVFFPLTGLAAAAAAAATCYQGWGDPLWQSCPGVRRTSSRTPRTLKNTSLRSVLSR